MRVEWAAGTATGPRERNEDDFYPKQDGSGAAPVLLAVADGLGGHPAGDVASRETINAAIRHEGGFYGRIDVAHKKVTALGNADPGLYDMGSTLTLCEISEEGILRVGNVGDSRAYLLRGDISRDVLPARYNYEQITNDHINSWGMLTQAIGVDYRQPDTYKTQLHAGDRVMLCSDGLYRVLTKKQIRRCLEEGTAAQSVKHLIESATQDATDNITVVVADLKDSA